MNQRKPPPTAVLAQAAQMDWVNDVPVHGLNAEHCLLWLHAWAELGWLRRLDSALATQLHRLDATTSPAVLVAAAVLAQMEGRGHTCLAVHALAAPPVDWLGAAAPDVQAFALGLPALWASRMAFTYAGSVTSALHSSWTMMSKSLDQSLAW